MDKPVIDYPCVWGYRIIGRDEADLRDAVTYVVDVDYQLAVGNRSTNSRYCSMHLTVEVKSESERVGLFESLRQRPEVLYVL